MKKIISILIVFLIAINLSGCYWLFESDSNNEIEETPPINKVYGLYDMQEMEGVRLTVTKLDGGKYFNGYKSQNGEWVGVFFTMENLNDEPYRISYLYFTLNDTYTIRNTSYLDTNIESGGFYLLKGTVYEFYCVYDCTYGYIQKDLKFVWEGNSFFSGTREWVL